MEHGRDGQQRVLLRDGHGVCVAQALRMEIEPAVRVDHALGVAGGGGGETHGGGRVFIDFRKLVAGVACRNQVFVNVQGRERSGRRRDLVHHHIGAHVGEMRCDGFHLCQQIGGKEQRHVLCMIDGVDEMLIRQPQVRGMQHPARARYAEIHLQMPVGVPRQGGHFLTCGDAQCLEGAGKTAHARAVVLVGVPEDAAVVFAIQDFVAREILFRTFDQSFEIQVVNAHGQNTGLDGDAEYTEFSAGSSTRRARSL